MDLVVYHIPLGFPMKIGSLPLVFFLLLTCTNFPSLLKYISLLPRDPPQPFCDRLRMPFDFDFHFSLPDRIQLPEQPHFLKRPREREDVFGGSDLYW